MCTRLALKPGFGGKATEICQPLSAWSRTISAAKSGGRRAKVVIGDAVAEIQGLHAEVARAVSSGLGLRSLR